MKLLFFSAGFCTNCGPAKKLIKNMQLDTIDFDADKNPSEFKTYNVKGIPSLVLLDNNGVEISRLTGKITLDNIESFLTQGGYNAE